MTVRSSVARLILFGPARDAAGTRHGDVDGASVQAVLDEAVRRYGTKFADVLATSQVWVNGDACELSSPVGPHDEVAVLPPVSGG